MLPGELEALVGKVYGFYALPAFKPLPVEVGTRLPAGIDGKSCNVIAWGAFFVRDRAQANTIAVQYARQLDRPITVHEFRASSDLHGGTSAFVLVASVKHGLERTAPAG